MMEVCEATAFAHETRTSDRIAPQTRQDFGGTETHLLHLRRIGKSLSEFDIKKDFGLYLGKQREEFIVGIKNPFSFEIVESLEIFSSLEELKKEWELD